MNHYKILSWVALLTSLILLVLPRIIPVCTGLTGGLQPMLCHYTYQAEFIITLLAVIFSGSLFMLTGTEARLLNGIVILLLGSTILLLPQPWVIGICHDAGACHKTTFFVTLGGSLFTATGALLIWLNVRNSREDD